MSASDHKFVIFRDLKDGYRWRLRSTRGETLEISRGHYDKGVCEQEVHRLREDRYPGAKVRDVSAGGIGGSRSNFREETTFHALG
jgi:uncharacterized protein YegP (UPF0339 family)